MVPSTYHENRDTLLERIQTEIEEDGEAESEDLEFIRAAPAGSSQQ